MFGIVGLGGFNTAMEVTNTEAFCISWHEMWDKVYQEYKKTVHYSNRTGVRATCPGCHVPNEWTPMLVRKVRATNELFHAVRGSINTREKFLAKRLDLAHKVWESMQQTDSRECRNCHGYGFMDIGKQRMEASSQHLQGQQDGDTCIDCHQGIAHELPEEFIAAKHDRYEKEEVPYSRCHAGMARAPAGEEWDRNKDD